MGEFFYWQMPDGGSHDFPLSLDRVKAIAPGYDIVPVYMEILSDVRTPISVLKALKQVSSHTYLLESADNSNHWGRYSFLGYDPKIELFCKNHKMTIKDGTTRTLSALILPQKFAIF